MVVESKKSNRDRKCRDGASVNKRDDATTTRSQIWLLQARAFENDQRTPEAKDMKVYLVPGREYTLGKNAKACDIAVLQDKSVSGMHARLSVRTDGNEGVGHVLVTDTSTWGTSISKDGKNIHKEEKLNKGCVGRAYHGYLVKFGVFSPFQVTRVMGISVYVGQDIGTNGREEIHACGLGVLNTIEEVGKNVVMVVGGPEVALDDDILFALVQGMPVVTLEWVRAWSQSIWIGHGPPMKDYMCKILCGCGYLDPEVSAEGVPEYHLPENQDMMSYQFIFPWGGVLSRPLARVLHDLGVAFYNMEEPNGLEWTCSASEIPVVVLDQENGGSTNVAAVLNSLCLPVTVQNYCYLNDLRNAIVSDTMKQVVRSVREIDECDDGWHVVEREPITTGDSKDAKSTRNDTSIVSDELLVKTSREQRTRKGFVKKYRAEPCRDVIDLVVLGADSELADNDEWAAMEREKRQEKLQQDAFERLGKKNIPKKRTRKTTK